MFIGHRSLSMQLGHCGRYDHIRIVSCVVSFCRTMSRSTRRCVDAPLYSRKSFGQQNHPSQILHRSHKSCIDPTRRQASFTFYFVVTKTMKVLLLSTLAAATAASTETRKLSSPAPNAGGFCQFGSPEYVTDSNTVPPTYLKCPSPGSDATGSGTYCVYGVRSYSSDGIVTCNPEPFTCAHGEGIEACASCVPGGYCPSPSCFTSCPGPEESEPVTVPGGGGFCQFGQPEQDSEDYAFPSFFFRYV